MSITIVKVTIQKVFTIKLTNRQNMIKLKMIFVNFIMKS